MRTDVDNWMPLTVSEIAAATRKSMAEVCVKSSISRRHDWVKFL